MGFTQRWADGYKAAWEADDPDAAAALYAPDCVFRSAPFRKPEPPIEYTRREYPEARAEDVRFGEPVEEGDRGAVEWWATLVSPDGAAQVIADDRPIGRCVRARDQILKPRARGHCNPPQKNDRDVALPALELRDVALRHAGCGGENLARHAAHGAQVPHAGTKRGQEFRLGVAGARCRVRGLVGARPGAILHVI